jgi:hypothetical protein
MEQKKKRRKRLPRSGNPNPKPPREKVKLDEDDYRLLDSMRAAKVPVYEIANYLKISEDTLARIRERDERAAEIWKHGGSKGAVQAAFVLLRMVTDGRHPNLTMKFLEKHWPEWRVDSKMEVEVKGGPTGKNPLAGLPDSELESLFLKIADEIRGKAAKNDG